MRRFGLITISVWLMGTVAMAQGSEQSWENLRRLRVGQRIQVVEQNLKSQDGTFVSFSEEAISFRVGQNEAAVQRGDVLRVSSREGMGRGKHALIGLAIGAGGGIGVGAGLANLFADTEDVLYGRALGVLIPLGAGIGAGTGAALPSGRPTLYRAERRTDQTAP